MREAYVYSERSTSRGPASCKYQGVKSGETRRVAIYARSDLLCEITVGVSHNGAAVVVDVTEHEPRGRWKKHVPMGGGKGRRIVYPVRP